MTTPIRSWSLTAAGNNQTPPNGAPEGGTFVNQLSDIIRQLMASVRQDYETAEWKDFGHTPTFVSGTVFTVTGDRRTTYQVGRRVRAINSTLTTIYGTITVSAYTVTTSVTVSWDSGVMDSTLAEVAVGAASVTNPSIFSSAVKGLGALATKSTTATADYDAASVTAAKIGFSATDRLMGRATAAAGPGEEITCTAYARTLLDDADAATARATLGVRIKNSVIATTNTSVGVTANIPTDNTIPQNNEGTEVLTVSITPSSASSIIRVRYSGYGVVNATGTPNCALFRDSGVNALEARAFSSGNTGFYCVGCLEFDDAPNTTSAVTYKIRVGPNNAITFTHAPALFSTAGLCSLIAEEI